ncbi:MAG: Coenzyme F420-dependent N10-methylene tetrahydromethanopterin reductase-like protein [Sphaerisporangium sp.]|nr:Coenzyme F420-dependent N10-methylene tetrahydromethanopterin reductase-like protein [Sphaerisporangium sp.]
MKLGAIIEWADDLSTFRSLIRLADDLGYDVIGVGDTPARAWELYVSLTVAAQESRNAILTPMVTTPFLRHPAATATAISTLHEVTGGRVMLAIGNGGSVRRIVGRLPVATPKELYDYVKAVREILDGRTTVVDGLTTEALTRVRPMPIHVAADYPQSLRLAGELADGVITTVGMSTELVERKIATVRDAAEKAGRDPDAIEVWGFSFISIRDTRAEANAEIGSALASDVALRLKSKHMRAKIPPHLLGAVEEMERRYDVWDHTIGGKNAMLLEELGLVDFAAGLTGITGDLTEVGAHLNKLQSLGVSGVLAALPVVADPAGTLRRLSQAAASA